MRFIRIALCGTLLFALGSGVTGCAKASVENTQLAATVNGAPIYESKVDAYLDAKREGNTENNKDGEWEEWLASSGYTQDSYRALVLESLIEDELVRQAANEAGITLNPELINSQINEIRAHYDSDDAWENALESSGYTEEEYRHAIELSYFQAKLKETQLVVPAPSDEQRRDYYASYAPSYSSKKSSYILLSSDDEQHAKDLCRQLSLSADLATDFATTARQESIEANTAIKGGDTGWSSLNPLPADYLSALDILEIGHMTTEPVMSDYGYYLIYCSDEFIPDNTNGIEPENIPAEIKAKLDADLNSQLKTQAFNDYLAALRNKATIVINPDKPSSAAA